MRSWLKSLLILFMTVFLLGLALVLTWINFLSTPVISQQPVRYIYSSGSSVWQLANDLHKDAKLKHPWMFVAYIALSGNRKKLKAGEYIFPRESTPYDIVDQLVNGEVAHHQITLVEGWNLKDDLEALSHNPDLKHTLAHKTPAQIAHLLGINKQGPEGWFFPATYYFSYGNTDLNILQRAHQSMQHYLLTAWSHRNHQLPYDTPYKALVVASMIQREAYYDFEMPKIAGVIVNRLQRDMPLQIDATVIYGLHRPIKHVTYRELHIKTPYNTYLLKGLPPTPIAQPGKAAIKAALHPENMHSLYYVAKPDHHHIFSKTLKAHDKAILWIKHHS